MTTITTTLTWRDNELFAGGRRMGWAVSLRPPVPKWQAGRLFQGRGTRHDTEAESPHGAGEIRVGVDREGGVEKWLTSK